MKKLLVLALASVLLMGSVFANGQKENTDEIPTIKWVQIGNGMPDNYDAWQAKVNTYLEEKIGCHVDVEVISWGDFKTRRSVIINTNEDYDIIFTPQDVFINDVMIGAFADISDKVKTDTPDLYNLMPESYWKATSIDGKIYGVPTYKDSSMTNYWVWRKSIVDKYDLDLKDFQTYDDLTPMLKKITEGEHEPAFVLAMDAMEIAQEKYDFLGSGLTTMGVSIEDGKRTVVSVYEQEDILSVLRVMHEWYEKGIINSDAAIKSEAPRNLICKVAQGWSTAAETVWGPQMGEPAVAYQKAQSILTNDTVRGSINCINANSKLIDESLEFLELLNTDSVLRDMFSFGEPDVDYIYTSDNKIHRNNASWPMASYSQATFFSMSKLDTETVDQWAEVKELNKNATPSVMLGFTMATESVEDEIANCAAVYAKFKLQVITGASNPDEIVPQMMTELRNAGFDDVMAEAQKQVDAAYNK